MAFQVYGFCMTTCILLGLEYFLFGHCPGSGCSWGSNNAHTVLLYYFLSIVFAIYGGAPYMYVPVHVSAVWYIRILYYYALDAKAEPLSIGHTAFCSPCNQLHIMYTCGHYYHPYMHNTWSITSACMCLFGAFWAAESPLSIAK